MFNFSTKLLSVSLNNFNSNSVIDCKAINELSKQRVKTNFFGYFIGLIVICLGTVFDYILYPTVFFDFFLVRFTAASIIISLVLLHLYSKNLALNYITSTTFVLCSCITVIVTLMIWRSDGASSPYFGGYMLTLMGMSFVLRVSFREALFYCFYCLSQYALGCYLNHTNALGFADEGLGLTEFNYPYFLNGILFIFVACVLCLIGTKKYNQELFERLKNQYQASLAEDKLKNFVMTISHELKTPLSFIINALDDITQETDVSPDEKSKLVVSFKRNSYRLLFRFRQLIDVLKTDQSNNNVQKNHFYIDDIVELLVEDVKQQCLQSEVNINVIINDRPKPDAVLYGTPIDMENAVVNILSNAVKFSDLNGEITIDRSVQNNNYVLTITDLGKGMTDHQMQTLFEPYSQGSSPEMNHYQGTGLGANIALRAVKMHNGEIEVIDSGLNKGTSIQIRIPLPNNVPVSEVLGKESFDPILKHEITHQTALRQSMTQSLEYKLDNTDITLPIKVRNQRTHDNSTVDKQTILIIDDEPSMRQIIKRMLSKLDVDIIEVSKPDQGIKLAKQIHPDVILLDYMMPGMNGLQVLAEIRADNNLRDIQIILLTAFNEGALSKDTLESGAVDFIDKENIDTELLSRVIAKLRTAFLINQISSQNNTLRETLMKLQDTQVQLVQSENRRIQSEKLTMLGRLADGLLHHFSNPLAIATTHSQHLRENTHGTDVEQSWLYLLDSIDRMKSTIRRLREFAHPNHTEMVVNFNVKDTINEAVNIVGLNETGIGIVIEPSDCFAKGDPSSLSQVVVTVLMNAIDSLVASKIKTPKITVKMNYNDADSLCILIIDNGNGFKGHESEIFNEYYTTKLSGEGTGLGLSVARMIARKMNGDMKAVTPKEGGACIAVTFPRGEDGR